MALSFESFFPESPISGGLESPKCDVVIDDILFCNSLLEADNLLLSELKQGNSETKSPFEQSENGMSEEITSSINSDATSEADVQNSEPFFKGADQDLLEYFGGNSSDEDGSRSVAKLETHNPNKENVETVTINAYGRIIHNGKGRVIPVRNVPPMTRKMKSAVDINGNQQSPNAQTMTSVKIRKNRYLDGTVDPELAKVLEEKSRKSAEQARINREKKKAYMQGLENDVERLKSENNKLQSENKTLISRTVSLEEEVEYLKSVLANESSLSKLLKNIDNVKDIRLSSSFGMRKRANLDHSYESEPPLKRQATAGICLHVDQNDVSLEFCSHCSKMAKFDQDK